MAACTHCGARILESGASARCPGCGKVTPLAASSPSPPVSSSPTVAPDLELAIPAQAAVASSARPAPAAPMQAPDLDLAVRAPPPPKPRSLPKPKPVEEAIDLAVDLASLRPQAMLAPSPVSERRPTAPSSGLDSASMMRAAVNAPARPNAPASAPLPLDPELEARTLANYGAAPSSIAFAPLYAYRVWKRRGELRLALGARRDEAMHAARALEDAMCALGERVRPIAAKDPQAARTLELLRDSEELLRTRDATLAQEHDVHRERIRANDARIASIEAELVAAKSEERSAKQILADANAAVQRAEAKLKRAEIEMRNLAAAQAARKTLTKEGV